MKNTVFLDIESKFLSTDFPDGWGFAVPHYLDPAYTLTDSNVFKMGFGLAATYDNDSVRYWDDPQELLAYLLSPQCDGIVTFNGERFDFNLLLGDLEPPVIQNGVCTLTDGFKEVYTMFAGKSIDVLVHIENTLNHRLGLGQLTEAMFNQAKSMDGTAFWPMWTGPDISKRVKALNYLMQDVVDLYRVYGVGVAAGKLSYRDPMGNPVTFEIKLPTVNEAGGPF